MDTADRLKLTAYMSAGNELDLGERGSGWREQRHASLYSRVAEQARRRYETSVYRGRRETETLEAGIMTVVEKLGMSVREIGYGQHILEVASEDKARAEGSDIIGGEVVAYTDQWGA